MARVPIFDEAGVPRYIGGQDGRRAEEHSPKHTSSRCHHIFSALANAMRLPPRAKLKSALDSTLFFCAQAAIASTGVLPYEMLPPTTMDKVTAAKLEAVRRRNPKYLYRLWSNGKANETPSGGRVGLNTTEAITPLAFSPNGGGGHQNVYQMTKDEFTDMARRHLRVCTHIETEFSSWTASLSYILHGCPGIGSGNVDLNERDTDEMHISIIDVEMLWDTNQIFYVPLLDFLSPGNMNFAHEYLVHGKIEGPWYKAIPYSALKNVPELCITPHWHFGGDEFPSVRLTEEDVRWACKLGELFGDKFALPMTLAVLCCTKRDSDLWMHGVGSQDIDILLEGIEGLEIPESWKKRHPVTGHTISCENFSDTRQMTTLVRKLVRHFRSHGIPSGKNDREQHGALRCPALELKDRAADDLEAGDEDEKEMCRNTNRGPDHKNATAKVGDAQHNPGQDVREFERTSYGLDRPSLASSKEIGGR